MLCCSAGSCSVDDIIEFSKNYFYVSKFLYERKSFPLFDSLLNQIFSGIFHIEDSNRSLIVLLRTT